jgi:hypothetical protein
MENRGWLIEYGWWVMGDGEKRLINGGWSMRMAEPVFDEGGADDPTLPRVRVREYVTALTLELE